jgi:hypothetical protein
MDEEKFNDIVANKVLESVVESIIYNYFRADKVECNYSKSDKLIEISIHISNE